MRHLATVLVSLLCAAATLGGTLTEVSALGEHFKATGVTGTFVLFDPDTDTTSVYNSPRAQQRFFPASTFKIPNALIALDVGSVKDLEEVIPYGGTKEYLKVWEQDMNLREAMKVSNVAVFHQLARRTGLTRMKEKVDAFDYGNREIGSDIDHRFWLNGPLTISALEQVAFLHKLTTGKLPVSERAVKLTSEILLLEKSEHGTLHAKTGWVLGEKKQPGLGWWVGWVKRGGQSYPFALNIDIKEDGDAPKRIAVGRACLKDLGKL